MKTMKLLRVVVAVVALLVALTLVADRWFIPEVAYKQQSVSLATLSESQMSTGEQARYYGQYMPVPAVDINQADAAVLGTEDGSNKRIEVDLTNQRLYAFEGDTKVHDFLISSGKWGKTPVGVFKIWYKTVSTKMSGGSKALRTYYYLPNVPYTMFFYNAEIPQSRGYGVHGAYWHNNFGHPMSHGCINMKPDEAKTLFLWSEPSLPAGKRVMPVGKDVPSTPIVIYGTAPAS